VTSSLTVRLGGWLFKRRTWLPLPLAAIILLTPGDAPSLSLEAAGALLVAAGELLRLWGVHHIGVISRTRGDRLGPLVSVGPFAYVRNPLYLGNVALWSGFAVAAGLPWLAPVLIVALGSAYHAIVRWEEELLTARLGDEYRDYAARVPRWMPSGRAQSAAPSVQTSPFSWRDTLFSERGTLIAIAIGWLLILVKLINF
jgi:protein-S-isoprenylcysteine O-methyltransferase Ste14